MKRQDYQVDDIVSKTSEDAILWRTERGMVEIAGNALAISVRVYDGRRGYVLHGKGRLLLDAIVETEEGAIGKSIERDLSNPFLMLGEADGIDRLLTEASAEDISEIGYRNQQECIAKAEDLCHRFLKNLMHGERYSDYEDGVIFAFQDETGELGVLFSKGSKLVYKAGDTAFVASGDKVVLKGLGETVCKSSHSSVVVMNGRSVVIGR